MTIEFEFETLSDEEKIVGIIRNKLTEGALRRNWLRRNRKTVDTYEFAMNTQMKPCLLPKSSVSLTWGTKKK